MRMILAMLALTAMIASCGEKKEIKDSVFAPQFKALEKARSVEDKLKQGAEKNREVLESSEKSGAVEQK